MKSKKIVIAQLAIFACSVVYAPQTLSATQQELNNSTLDEVIILRDAEFRNANSIIQSCNQGAELAPTTKTSCDIQELQYKNYFTQFQLYINKRMIIEGRN